MISACHLDFCPESFIPRADFKVEGQYHSLALISRVIIFTLFFSLSDIFRYLKQRNICLHTTLPFSVGKHHVDDVIMPQEC